MKMLEGKVVSWSANVKETQRELKSVTSQESVEKYIGEDSFSRNITHKMHLIWIFHFLCNKCALVL